MAPDPTVEGLCRLLLGGQPIAGLFSAEGGQLIGGHGMSNDHRLKTAATLSSLWDGDPVRRVRAGDGVVILPGRRVCLHLMAQPEVASLMLGDPLLANQGLLSRMLVTAPDPAAGTRFWRDPRPESDAALQRYEARLLEVLEAALPLAEGKTNELAPPQIVLSPEAQRTWVDFADHLERRLGPGGECEQIAGLANKLAEHAARIGAVLALADDISASSVKGPFLAAGIELAQHYAAEALRLFSASAENSDLRLAERRRVWLLSRSDRLISLPDIYQRGPNAIGDAKTARRLVSILEEHGWLVRLDEGALVGGTFRRDVWQVVRGSGR